MQFRAGILANKFQNAIDNLSIVNETLCNENFLGRWVWQSGNLKTGYLIPWEMQTANTAPDNFLWEKDKTSIMVVTSGFYQVIVAIFSVRSPTFQLLINGDPIISTVNTANNVISHTLSGKQKIDNTTQIAGLSINEYVRISERARLAVSFTGDASSQGFIMVRKI